MTFEQPALLLLALLVGVLWWLHRRLAQPEVIRVPSLLPYRDAAADAAPASASRQFDLPFWLLAFAIVSLAAAAAGPHLRGGGGPSAYVVVDRSASMARDGAETLRRARRLIEDAVPGVRISLHPLDDPGGPGKRRDGQNGDGRGDFDPPDADWAARWELEDGLPGTLTPHLADAGAHGFPGLVLVTDRDVPPIRGLVVVRPRKPVRRNIAFSGAVMDDDGRTVRCYLEMHGKGPADVEVAGASERVTVVSGESTFAVVPAPPPGGSAEITLRLVGDESAEDLDDRLVLRRCPWTGRVRWTGPEQPLLRAALGLMGLQVVDDPTTDVDLRVAVDRPIDEPGPVPTLYVSPSGGTASIELVGDGPEFLEASRLRAEGDGFPALPAPSTRLVADGRLRGGTSSLADDAGALVVAAPGLLATTLDPDAPGSTWHEDPSFPAFVAAAVAHLRGDSELVVEELVPPSERIPSLFRPTTPSAADLAAVVRRVSADETPAVGGLFAVLGSALLAVGGVLLWWRVS